MLKRILFVAIFALVATLMQNDHSAANSCQYSDAFLNDSGICELRNENVPNYTADPLESRCSQIGGTFQKDRGAGYSSCRFSPTGSSGAGPSSSGSLTCPSGFGLCGNNTCAPLGSVCCGGGYCSAGNICTNENICLAESDPRHCGGGRYCSIGNICTNDQTCLAVSSERYCGDGRYCEVGLICTEFNRCITRKVAALKVQAFEVYMRAANRETTLSPDAEALREAAILYRQAAALYGEAGEPGSRKDAERRAAKADIESVAAQAIQDEEEKAELLEDRITDAYEQFGDPYAITDPFNATGQPAIYFDENGKPVFAPDSGYAKIPSDADSARLRARLRERINSAPSEAIDPDPDAAEALMGDDKEASPQVSDPSPRTEPAASKFDERALCVALGGVYRKDIKKGWETTDSYICTVDSPSAEEVSKMAESWRKALETEVD